MHIINTSVIATPPLNCRGGCTGKKGSLQQRMLYCLYWYCCKYCHVTFQQK